MTNEYKKYLKKLKKHILSINNSSDVKPKDFFGSEWSFKELHTPNTIASIYNDERTCSTVIYEIIDDKINQIIFID